MDTRQMQGIYLDYNATTPVLPAVLSAMIPFFCESPGNPSSAHSAGNEARTAIEYARAQIAELVGAPPDNVLFTSSATEAINTAFHSATFSRRETRSRIVITAVEHPAVRQCALAAEERGSELVQIPVNASGTLALDRLADAMSTDTCIVSVMWANNETGVIFPIAQIAELCADRGVPLHVDAVQAAGKLPIDLEEVPIDYLSMSAHKLFGPKGVGALIASPQIVKPVLRGGNQETGRRAGTENVPAIVGFGEAARLAALELQQRAVRVRTLRDRLEQVLFQNINGCRIYGAGQPRIPNTTNVGFDGVDGDALAGVLNASGVYVSTGSACSANTVTPSHVVMAMTGSYERAGEAIRFSLSHLNTDSEIERTIAVVEQSVASLRLTQAPA
jgi:cysteine desulfurase